MTKYEVAKTGLTDALETLRELQVIRNHAWATAMAAVDGDYGRLPMELIEEFEEILRQCERHAFTPVG